MVLAVEMVRERLLRATAALEQAGVPYAVIGGNAVAAWVARVDEAAVRNTQDVDILLRRADLPAARAALEKAGFVYRHAAGIDMFLDGPDAKARDAVHVLFEREKVRQNTFCRRRTWRNPKLAVLPGADARRPVANEVTSFRDKDRIIFWTCWASA